MKPDYERAAIAAAETLIKYGINSAPVSAMPVLQEMPGVLVVSYETLSNDTGSDRTCMLYMFGDSQDAFTSVNLVNGKTQYLVTYNQRLPANLVQRALARELGHIVLGHDGSLPDDVRFEEARAFANHFLCPRPLIHALQASAVRMTTETLGNLTGCYEYCLSCMRRIPAVHVPPELNRKVLDNFMPFIINFFEFQRSFACKDGSALADFGTYMEGYEE